MSWSPTTESGSTACSHNACSLYFVACQRNKDDNTEAQNTGSALSERCLALIPLWDMMNHEDGPICTYFETDTNTIESDAMNDVDAGGEVRMFYGARSNTDLMLHCGFFVKDNAHDVFSMSMIVSKYVTDQRNCCPCTHVLRIHTSISRFVLARVSSTNWVF